MAPFDFEYDDVDCVRELPPSVRAAREADFAVAKRASYWRGVRLGFIAAMAVFLGLLVVLS